ncbi:uncharacterized protein LOC115627574 isoform X2 [Scaptodrosophila lebanonensis]|uniref:Uncharacterized protein LOC115627574 isoform X2 n=1 Tax=Drosophila lebanonensis TaxID=7225 RepID=A0A6J2TR81_DROLE|nr:uncharacterized protein LOC115627574 isoform X2 [Scaptodrosophila lebanonensis]
MAPFKLKFRMGSSRSTSQEHDPDPQVNEALLGAQHQEQQQQQQQKQLQQQAGVAMGASSSTIDSTDCNSLGSMGNNASERKLLLPNKTAMNSNSLRLGYINQGRTPCINESPTDTDTLPTTPPPSYEHVLEENTRLSQHQRQLSSDSATPNQNSRRSSANSSRHSVNLSVALEQLALNAGAGNNAASNICNDPDCQQNYNSCTAAPGAAGGNQHNNNNGEGQIIEGVTEVEVPSDNEYDIDCNERVTVSVNEFLLETEMAASSREEDKLYDDCRNEQCTDAECAQCSEDAGEGGEASTSSGVRPSFYDPLLNRDSYDNYNEGNLGGGSPNNGQACNEPCCTSASSSSRSRRRQQQNCHSSLLSPELMSNKTSKEIYKDLAKQWGITCKMSESCRCMDCQSHYFDCDFDDNEHQKTDGGLGAGTPMFISEVMHGSACNIL